MDIINKLQFILKETNLWWQDRDFKMKDYVSRAIFPQIEDFLKLRQIIALVGLRRTGKTTLMLKLVEDYLKKISHTNILYFSFDDFSLLDLEDLLVAYREIFPKLNLKTDSFLFCLDEVQKLKNWQEKIKRLYDTYPNVKMVISGSESLFLRKRSKETLGGRIFEFSILPLTFKEYLRFTKKENLINNIELYKEVLKQEYRNYLRINGFPELVGIEDNLVIHKYLKESIIDKILFKDIPTLFKIGNVEILGEILDIIMFSPGQIIDMTKLSKELKISRQSVSLYLTYLEKSFLIKKLYNFSKNLRKQKRALKKYYPAVIFPSMVDNNLSVCIENSLIWQLEAQFFYRDVYKNEVDIILVDEKKNFSPLEIKTGKIETGGIAHFLKKYKIEKGIILSLDYKGKRQNIEIIPLYQYLLQ